MTKNMPAMATDTKGRPAGDIPVALFRQIHHMPLVWQGKEEFQLDAISRNLTSKNGGWHEIANPLRALAEDRDHPDPESFNEVVYFHDFAREFLYPNGKNRAFRLFEKREPGEITASFANNGGTHDFTIERLTLHIFRTKTAMLTVETLHKPQETPITLAQVQTIIDHFRRSYTPFWTNGSPARVPSELCLSTGVMAIEQKQGEMIAFLEENRGTCADAPLLEPWAGWMQPLSQNNWRDPSDERVPVMSFILLEKTANTNRDTLNQICESDWYRLAEADESGDMFEYNPDFLRQKQFFFDRFLPDPAMPDYLATRHIFGGAHYCVVSVDDWFSRNIIQAHFRRHYEKMALVARFEFATLLAFSSRITNAVKMLDEIKHQKNARDRFRREILDIHEDFLEFTHRYRFTGISSQIQAGEMFDHWRASLGLDRLYQDVKDEISSASLYAQAVQAKSRAGDANALARVAILVGALVSAPALNKFDFFKNMNTVVTDWLGWQWAGPVVSFMLPFTIVALTAELLFRWLRQRERRA